MNVLLIGASGRSGRLVAARLRSAKVPFRALIRSEKHKNYFESLGALTVLADLTRDFSHAFAGVDTVIFTAGSAETEGQDFERLIDRDAVKKAVDYARQHGADRFVLVSTLLAYAPEDAPKTLRHYARMKRESDDYLIGSGLKFLVLRPGTLTMEPGTGTIEIVTDAASARMPVAREDVAEVVLKALQRGMSNKIIGFGGGDEPIDEALARL